MFILTGERNVIIEISNTYELDEEHRNIILNNYNIAYAPNEIINAYEVEEVPEGVKTYKYCYTEEQGFYINADYTEPVNTQTEQEERLTNIELALAELYETIEGGN